MAAEFPVAAARAGGQRAGDPPRHHLAVGQGHWREVVGDGGQLDGPVRVGVVHRELRAHELGDTVKHRGLLGTWR